MPIFTREKRHIVGLLVAVGQQTSHWNVVLSNWYLALKNIYAKMLAHFPSSMSIPEPQPLDVLNGRREIASCWKSNANTPTMARNVGFTPGSDGICDARHTSLVLPQDAEEIAVNGYKSLTPGSYTSGSSVQLQSATAPATPTGVKQLLPGGAFAYLFAHPYHNVTSTLPGRNVIFDSLQQSWESAAISSCTTRLGSLLTHQSYRRRCQLCT